jgi:hypothetical protein
MRIACPLHCWIPISILRTVPSPCFMHKLCSDNKLSPSAGLALRTAATLVLCVCFGEHVVSLVWPELEGSVVLFPSGTFGSDVVTTRARNRFRRRLSRLIWLLQGEHIRVEVALRPRTLEWPWNVLPIARHNAPVGEESLSLVAEVCHRPRHRIVAARHVE